jgi:hypothetical protein
MYTVSYVQCNASNEWQLEKPSRKSRGGPRPFQIVYRAKGHVSRLAGGFELQAYLRNYVSQDTGREIGAYKYLTSQMQSCLP